MGCLPQQVNFAWSSLGEPSVPRGALLATLPRRLSTIDAGTSPSVFHALDPRHHTILARRGARYDFAVTVACESVFAREAGTKSSTMSTQDRRGTRRSSIHDPLDAVVGLLDRRRPQGNHAVDGRVIHTAMFRDPATAPSAPHLVAEHLADGASLVGNFAPSRPGRPETLRQGPEPIADERLAP
jgi:hypothetical protein